ncbi:hypothetical protein ACF0H5_006549 [Mactra antiquata]
MSEAYNYTLEEAPNYTYQKPIFNTMPTGEEYNKTRIISVVEEDVHQVQDDQRLDDDVFNIINEPTCSTTDGCTKTKENKKRRRLA